MDDLISRQSALNEINHGVPVKGWEDSERVWELVNIFVNRIKQLPSAQPKIIRCKDCNHFYKDNLNQWCFLGKYGVKEDDFCSRAERKTNE